MLDTVTASILKERHGTVDLATVQLDVLHNKGSTGYYSDTEVVGLRRITRGEYHERSEWQVQLHRGIVNFHHVVGFYPELSLDQARDAGRTKLALIEDQILPPTGDECAAYDFALATLKSGDQSAKADVSKGFLRIAQALPEMAENLIIEPEKLPPSKILLMSLTDLELSTRAHNVLTNDGINIAAHLFLLTDTMLLRIPNCGRKSLAEIRQKVSAIIATTQTGLSLEPSLSLVVGLQRRIIAHLEEQTALMRASLSVLWKLDTGKRNKRAAP